MLRGVSMPTTPRVGTSTRSPSGVESARHVTGEPDGATACRAPSAPAAHRVQTFTDALALSCAQCLADARAAAHASSYAAPDRPPDKRSATPAGSGTNTPTHP